MPNRRLIFAFIAGWGLALLFPPQRLLGYFKKGS